jgi:hypothetical protein
VSNHIPIYEGLKTKVCGGLMFREIFLSKNRDKSDAKVRKAADAAYIESNVFMFI